ncbi:MAG: hypothetical protein MJZ02_01595 [Paludibacteraceae bacterium]|nr:hypothetical protein [Paludibacteraceae bacterium]
MNKKFLSLLAFASIFSLSVCNTSCSDDDEDEPFVKPSVNDTTGNGNNEKDPGSADQKQVKENAAKIEEGIYKYVAAGATSSDSLKIAVSLQLNINELQGLKDATLSNEVAALIAKDLGIEESSAVAIVNGNNVVNTISELTPAERASIIKNAQAYIQGYSDAKDLANAYATIADPSKSLDEKIAALDRLEYDIKNHYQTSNDTTYKKIYVSATADATGLSESVTKSILESENPKATAAAIFGINLGGTNAGGATAEQAATDAKEAADMVSSIKGQSLITLMNDASLIGKVSDLKSKYDNGSDEYKENFKQELVNNGISNDVIDILAKDGDVDIISLATALGVKLL